MWRKSIEKLSMLMLMSNTSDFRHFAYQCYIPNNERLSGTPQKAILLLRDVGFLTLMISVSSPNVKFAVSKIDKVIGEGSFGKALLCRRVEDDKRCIIKQISLGHLSPKEARQTQQEANLLERLNHPNIVSFWESFIKGSNLFIVMEFADGTTVHARIHFMFMDDL